MVGCNGGTHAYRRLRWLYGLGLAAVGVSALFEAFIFYFFPASAKTITSIFHGFLMASTLQSRREIEKL
jgi:hypothetical protein